jgi:hypothetical protein
MGQSAAFAISLVPAQREHAILKGRSLHLASHGYRLAKRARNVA